AVYLVYLGIQAVRHRNDLGTAMSARAEPKSIRRIAADGFLVGLTNPKAIVFFIAVLPQFVDRSAGHVPAQMLLLGAIFLAIAVVCDSCWALVAGTARTWLARSPRRVEVNGAARGMGLIGSGASPGLAGRSR